MKFFISCSLLLSLLCLLYLQPPVNATVDHDEPDSLRQSRECYTEEIGHLKPGQTITVPGRCSSASCHSDGSISLQMCGPIGTSDPNCDIGKEDLSKSFPQCCPKIVCDDIS